MRRSRWSLLLMVLALGWVAPARAEVPISENANRRFEEGVRYLRTSDPDRFEKAYVEFKAAYADSPSWKILGNLGIVAQALERYGEAIDAFEDYLAEGARELSDEEQAQVVSDLALLRGDFTTVTLTTTPDGAWIVDERLPEAGRPIVNRYGPTSGPLTLRIRSGHHRIHAELSGYSSDTWELNPAAGTTASHGFELRRRDIPNETPPSPATPAFDDRLDEGAGSSGLRTFSYVSFGVGAAGAVAGGVFLALAFDAQSDFDAEPCSRMACDRLSAEGRQLEALSEKEGKYRTGALASFIGAGAFITSGIICYVLSAPEDEPGDMAIMPVLSPNGVGVSGRF